MMFGICTFAATLWAGLSAVQSASQACKCVNDVPGQMCKGSTGLYSEGHSNQRTAHPSGLNTRTPDGGLFASLLVGLRGRTINSPPQLGQSPPNFCSVQVAQKVHSNEQIRACAESGGRSQSQHSQFGRNSSMSTSLMAGNFHLYI